MISFINMNVIFTKLSEDNNGVIRTISQFRVQCFQEEGPGSGSGASGTPDDRLVTNVSSRAVDLISNVSRPEKQLAIHASSSTKSIHNVLTRKYSALQNSLAGTCETGRLINIKL